MTTERWNEIYEGFAAALDRKPADRASYINDTFAHDAALRDEVARLLRDVQEAEQDGFLRGPAWIMDDIPLFLPDFQSGDSKFSTIEYIGHGGMGVVYKAYQSNFDRWVALKLSSPHLATSTDKERFRAEAQSMARLKHSNIVTVHETGEYYGRPYFVMDLIEGKSLNDRLGEFAEQPKEAASLVKTIALAVHHAHQRRILHNDLKPGNILLDGEGQPHVSDFGLAKRFGEAGVSSATGAVEGTASYMSPEQAEGKRELTTASDVYGLGAILYTLLTGAPPFRGESVEKTLELVQKQVPKPPRALNAKVDSTLEAISLKCLEKDKAKRYASANSVALDIGRYLEGKETLALPWTRRDRILGWARKNRVEAGLVAAVAAIWMFAVVMALSVAQTRKTDLLEATLSSASFAARDLAATALLQLRDLSGNLERVTADRDLVALFEKRSPEGIERYLARLCSDRPELFTTCYALDAEGIMVAHVPPGEVVIGQSFRSRDYFLGAEKQADSGTRSPHVSKVYRGTTDSLYKFAIVAPVMNAEGQFLGAIAASVTTNATMGLVDPTDIKREVALLAPRDPDSPGSENTLGDYAVLFHPAYRYGIDPVGIPAISSLGLKLAVSRDGSLQLPGASPIMTPQDDYTDPVASVDNSYAGRWIAGFAPVGNTGFVVVVQQRFEDAVSLEASTFWRLALWSALASLVALAILGMVLWRWTQGRRLETD